MKSFLLFQNTTKYLLRIFVRLNRLTKLQIKCPTCCFHLGASVDDESTLGNYNVIFEDVAIINSSIGAHTYIQRNSVITNADIGKFCSIAMGVSVGLAQHPTNFVSTHPAFFWGTKLIAKTYSRSEFSPFKRTTIGHDVWIGQNALIMSGVNIGTGAIIGAGAVVTKDVPDYAIVGGVPAKIIKYRFDEKIISSLLKTKWWDMPEDWFEKNHEYFIDPNQLINFINNSTSKN